MNVRPIPGTLCHARDDGGIIGPMGGILLPALSNGYERVRVYYKGGRVKDEYVHILVLRAYAGPRPTKNHEGLHGDGNRRNNKPGNLKWGTRKQNAADRKRHGTQVNARGEAHPHAKLTEALVLRIHKMRREGFVYERIAFVLREDHDVEVSKATVGNVCRGKSWKHIDPDLIADLPFAILLSDERLRAPLTPERVGEILDESMRGKADLRRYLNGGVTTGELDPSARDAPTFVCPVCACMPNTDPPGKHSEACPYHPGVIVSPMEAKDLVRFTTVEPTRIPDQPPPTGEGKEIWPIAIEDFGGTAFDPDMIEIEALIVEDMRERDAIGRARYGTPLRANNGRDALVDGYQEALDLVAYLTQANEEAEVVGTYDGELGAVYAVLVELRTRMQ